MNLTSSKIARLIQSDAHRYFDRRFRQLKSTWKPPSGPFGNMKLLDYYYRIEFQARGSPHVHMLVWIKDAPIYTPEPDNEVDVCKFLDSIISCKIYDAEEDTLMEELIHGDVSEEEREARKKYSELGENSKISP
ncbi:hypothetical protein INT47_000392 [Mucor saturninus]|uniref:Helitron helicase-like domain-containing protein n=1 Tax=Mucor saturninus TaxID=64648 RepID=A0A8H7QT19_9FUNG|nr:hypothetical protein INT47_000392 [Mucor saturninus]